MAWTWVDKNIVLAIHDEQIAEHGGETGMRDEGLLISALARPLDKANYEDANVISLAAAYGYGIARNHPFLDGNKRTAFVTMELFLILNDWELKADDGPCLEIFISLADGSLSEKDLTKWLKANTQAGSP
jgi:death on curing protein